MKLCDYIDPSMSWVLDDAPGRDTLLKDLSDRIAKHGDIDGARLYDALVSREQQGSTGTPEGICLPHAMLEDFDRSFVALARVKSGVDFQCPSTPSVDLVFVLVGPRDKAWEHVRLLARIARVCHRRGALQYLRGADTGEDLYRRLVEEDKRHV